MMKRLALIVTTTVGVVACGQAPTTPSPVAGPEEVALLTSTPRVGKTVPVARCTSLTGGSSGPCVYDVFGTQFSVRYDAGPLQAQLLVRVLDAGGRECLRGSSGAFNLEPGRASDTWIGPQRKGGDWTYYRFSGWTERCHSLSDRMLGSGCRQCSPPFDTVALHVQVLEAGVSLSGTTDPVFEAKLPAQFHWAAR